VSCDLPLRVTIKGVDWRLFSFSYHTCEGTFESYIYAVSHEHASHIIDELRQTAYLTGEVHAID
jgi:hypothetical protein